MTQDNYNPKEQISNYIEETAVFGQEQEVENKSWYLPTQTVENLRNYVIGGYGTTKHMGAFCTRAMLNWVQDEPTDEAHSTWSQLKNDYDYTSTDASQWNYRQYKDYTSVDKEDKTALGFSTPVSVVEAFTDNITKNEYGSELANAIESELLKMAQINQMKQLIENGDAIKTEETSTQTSTPKVEITEDGERANLNEITIEDTTAVLTQPDLFAYVEEHGEPDWETRRGLLGAYARSMGCITKEAIYTIDERILGVSSSRSRRKDYNAILEQAQKESEPLTVTPVKKIMDGMDTNNLVQKIGLTHRKNPLKKESDDYELDVFQNTIYNSEKTSERELFREMVDYLWDYSWNLYDYDWKKGDSVKRTYEGKHLNDTLEKVIEVIDFILQNDEDLYDLPPSSVAELEEILEALKEKKSGIKGVGGKSIEEAYNYFHGKDVQPKSKQWKKNN